MMMDCSPETYPSAMRVCWCNQHPTRLMKRTKHVVDRRGRKANSDLLRPQIHITSHNCSNRPGMATNHHSRPAESSRLNVQK